MAMIKCPECRHHISSMAKTCPECGCPIDPEWAKAEAEREQKKLDEIPFTVEVGGRDEEPETIELPPVEDKLEEEIAEDVREEHLPKEDIGNEPQAPSRSTGSIWIIAVVAVLGLVIGGLYYYDYRADQEREERAYELLQDCSNPTFYEDFIVRFKHSKHIDEVRERLKVVMAQQEEWQKLVVNGTHADLQQFVREHPNSPYVKVAQSRIDSLDWEVAKQAHTLEAVSNYISEHPDGYYIDHAEQLRQTLERQRAEAAAVARRDSIARADSIV